MPAVPSQVVALRPGRLSPALGAVWVAGVWRSRLRLGSGLLCGRQQQAREEEGGGEAHAGRVAQPSPAAVFSGWEPGVGA